MTSTFSWIEEFVTAANGNAPSEEDREAILALAGVAAHSSERTAAPLTRWVAAPAGLSPVAAPEIAHSLASQPVQDDPGLIVSTRNMVAVIAKVSKVTDAASNIGSRANRGIE